MSINPLQQQQQQTMNSAALSPYFCPYLIESSALLHLYIIATIPIRDAVEKYSCDTSKCCRNTPPNALQ